MKKLFHPQKSKYSEPSPFIFSDLAAQMPNQNTKKAFQRQRELRLKSQVCDQREAELNIKG